MLYSCTNDEFGEINDVNDSPSMFNKGAFVINEGLFNSGGGDISWINFENDSISNEIFRFANNFPPGDIPFHMALIDDFIFLTVNNSGKIYKLNGNFKVEKTISGIMSPREICIGPNGNLFVSSLYKPYIYVVNAGQGALVDSIYTGRPVENLLLHKGKLWATHWSQLASTKTNNVLLVIDPIAKQLSDSIIVGIEPNSMCIDKNEHIWILCSGGFDHAETARLVVVDPVSHNVVRSIQFLSANDYPTSLVVNLLGDTLYYINQHIYKMSVNATAIPSTHWVQSIGNTFYRLAVNPADNTIWASDAGNYIHAGKVLHYSPFGSLIKEFNAGVVPGYIIFKE